MTVSFGFNVHAHPTPPRAGRHLELGREWRFQKSREM